MWRGLVKFQFGGFPSTPITVLVREFKGPCWKGKTEKAAPVSKLDFPLAFMSSFPWSLIRNTFFLAFSASSEVGSLVFFLVFVIFSVCQDCLGLGRDGPAGLPSILSRFMWIKFLSASMSLPQNRARFPLSSWVTSFIIINGLLAPLGHSLQ